MDVVKIVTFGCDRLTRHFVNAFFNRLLPRGIWKIYNMKKVLLDVVKIATFGCDRLTGQCSKIFGIF